MNDSYRPFKAHLFLAFLIILNVLNFVDRYLIQSLSPLIVEDLGLSYTQIGLLSGFYFVVFYSLIGLFMGSLADRFNRPRLMAGGLLLWSLLTAVTGAAGKFWHMAAARIFVGIGEASLTPAALSMLSDKFPPERRAFAAGMYYAGIPLGMGLSLIIAGTVGTELGWRKCFYILGLIGIAMSVVLLFVKNPRRGAMEPDGGIAANAQPKQTFMSILKEITASMRKSKSLCMVIFGGGILVFGMGASILDQLWLVNERGYSQKNAAQIFGLLFIVSGTIGNYVGGSIADWCHKRWAGGRLLFLAWMEVFIIPVVLISRFIPPDTFLFYACSFLGGMSAMMMMGPIFASVQDLVPIRIRSTSVGMLILGHNLLGTAPGNFVAGFLSDALQTAGWEEPLTYGTFFTRLIGLLAIPMFFIAAKHYQRDIDRMRAEEDA
jgi:MFS family permease